MPRLKLYFKGKWLEGALQFGNACRYWSVLVTSDGFSRLDFCLPKAGRNLVLNVEGIHRISLPQPETPFVIFQLQGYKQA